MIAKNFVKAWSFQASSLLALLIIVQDAMPTLRDSVPDDVFKWVTFALAVAVPLLRAKKQKSVSG